MCVNLYTILLEDAVWNWTKAKVVKDIVKLTTFSNGTTNRGSMYISKVVVHKWTRRHQCCL